MHFEFTVDGETFLVVTADTCPDQGGIDWLEGVLSTNTDKTVILAVHNYLTAYTSNPEDINVNKREEETDLFSICKEGTFVSNSYYQSVLKKYPNILLVLSGHEFDETSGYGGARVASIVNGSAINQLRSNFQDRNNTYFRIITIDTESDLIRVQSYSPSLNLYDLDPREDFYLSRSTFKTIISGATLSGLLLN
jgi:hypothetical protein